MICRTIGALLWLIYSSLVTAGMFFIYPNLATATDCVVFIIAAAGLGFVTFCLDKVVQILFE